MVGIGVWEGGGRGGKVTNARRREKVYYGRDWRRKIF
jgi:hypothetical protein